MSAEGQPGKPEQETAVPYLFKVHNVADYGLAAHGFVPTKMMMCLNGLTLAAKRVETMKGQPAFVQVSPTEVARALYERAEHLPGALWEGYANAFKNHAGHETVGARGDIRLPVESGALISLEMPSVDPNPPSE